jgi:hypothetical protein
MPTYKDFQRLLQSSQKAKANNKAQWYEQTYQLFISHQVNNINDFWKKVAFAYSWMPTIPKWTKGEIDEKWIMQMVNKIQEEKNY